MSVAQVRKVVNQFVESDASDFLLLKGGWGVGKTYFWKSIVGEASEHEKIGKESYAYISLFGVSDLEGLKNSVLAAKVSSSAVSKTAAESASQMLAQFKDLVKGIEKASKLGNYTGGLIATIAFRSIENTLVCFDDLERKSNSLEIKEILGLASYLKEQRNCKIVFISNEGTLSDEDIREFGRHSEKLVDIQLTFAPTAEEAFAIAFDSADEYYELARTSCLKLDIKNIRVLKRINRFISTLQAYLVGKENPVKASVISALILGVWSYYDKDSNPPSLDAVENFSFGKVSVNSYLKKDISEGDQRIHDLLFGKYGYFRTDDLDREVFKFVRTGYVDEATFLPELNSQNQQAIARKGNETFSGVWHMLHASFQDNEKEFVDLARDLFQKNVEFLELSDVDSIAGVLRSLDHESEADAMVDQFIALCGPKFTPEFSGTISYDNIRDAYLKKAVDDAIPADRYTYTFEEAFRILTEEPGFRFDLVKYLSSLEIDDFYEWVASIRSPQLYTFVRACLQMEEVNDLTGTYKSVGHKMRVVLERLAAENKINRVRISRMFGIEVPGKPSR